MILLLPPSETKTRPAAGAALHLDALAHGRLSSARETVLRAVDRTARGRGAAAALKVPASSPELVTRMAHLAEEPTGAPLDVYSGVLYDALGAAAPRPGRDVLITSALLGIVDARRDLIPAYRLSAGSTLSRLGLVGSWWRPRLVPIARELAASGRVVVDARSGAYRAMMPVPGALEIAAVRERDGVRTVVSHDAKRYRGLVARALLEAGQTAQDPDDVAQIAGAALPPGLDVELGHGVLTAVDRG